MGLEECADFQQGKGMGQDIGKRKGSNVSKRQKDRNVDIYSGQRELQLCRGRMLSRPNNSMAEKVV